MGWGLKRNFNDAILKDNSKIEDISATVIIISAMAAAAAEV
jgi:hypothetical protein